MFWTGRPQNRDTRNTTLFKRLARSELRIYMNDQQDGRLMSLGPEQKVCLGHGSKVCFYGNLLRFQAEKRTRDLCLRRLILAALKTTTQKQEGGLCGVCLSIPGGGFNPQRFQTSGNFQQYSESFSVVTLETTKVVLLQLPDRGQRCCSK